MRLFLLITQKHTAIHDPQPLEQTAERWVVLQINRRSCRKRCHSRGTFLPEPQEGFQSSRIKSSSVPSQNLQDLTQNQSHTLVWFHYFRKNSRRLWRSPKRNSRSVPKFQADFRVIPEKAPNPGRNRIYRDATKTPPKSRNTKKKTAFTRSFSKSLRELFRKPCDTSQEPNRNCSEKLGQMNFLENFG